MVKRLLATSILLAGISLTPAMQQVAEAWCIKVEGCVTVNDIEVCGSWEVCFGEGEG